jgi:hypothetical protein
MSTTEDVVVLVIQHNHGVNTYVTRTYDTAKEILLDYVSDWWFDTFPDDEMPANSDDAIEEYFNENYGREHYCIDEVYLINSIDHFNEINNPPVRSQS